MSDMTCYKCDATEELSAKKYNSDGTILFVCRACRREDYHVRKVTTFTKTQTVSKSWIQMAKEKNTAIAMQYKDEAFMKLRGLL